MTRFPFRPNAVRTGFLSRHRGGSVLLYVLFMSAFLASFVAAFRSELDSAVSETASSARSVVSASSLFEWIDRIRSDQVAGLASVTSYSFDSPSFDGRTFKGVAFPGSPLVFPVPDSAWAPSFVAYVASGWLAVVEVFGSTGSLVASKAVAVGQSADVPYPTLSGSVKISAQSGYSSVEIDRLGGWMRHPSLPVRAYRKAGIAFEYVGTFHSE